MQKARCLRRAGRLPFDLWPEIVRTAAYLNNRTPKRQLNWKTPYEALTGSKPSLSHLHVYGCRAYPLNKHIPRSEKLRERAFIGYLVGYDSTNIFRIWIPSQQKIIRTRDVTFNEELFYDPAEIDICQLVNQNYSQIVEIIEQPSIVDSEPDSFLEKQAAETEIRELEKRGTFKWMDKAAVQTTPLPLLWVFKYKFDTDGYLTKFKARICVRGDLQYTEQETYAAMLAARIFRAVMSIAAAFDLEIRQYDAVNAFVNSKIDEEVHCHAPEGFERQGSCWHLLRALYGLKQSPLLWYTDFTTALENLGLHAVPGVNCLFVNEFLLLFFYVDDIAILYGKKDHVRAEEFEQRLLKRFEMRSMEEMKWFLGIRIERDRPARKIWLCQDSYISKIATKFNASVNSKHPNTPLPYEDLSTQNDDDQATAQQDNAEFRHESRCSRSY